MRVTIASISKQYEEACIKNAKEYLRTADGNPRPCLILLTLVYKGKRMRFALPLRSNIHASSPKSHYHALPPTRKTQAGKRAGIHFAKMYPIPISEQRSYEMRSPQDKTSLKVIKRDFDDIQKEAQAFLDNHATIRKAYPDVVTDIDAIINKVLPNFNK